MSRTMAELRTAPVAGLFVLISPSRARTLKYTEYTRVHRRVRRHPNNKYGILSGPRSARG